MTPHDFEHSAEQFDLFAYFKGDTRAWGLFEDRFNNVRRQFTVDIHGTVDGNTLVLAEDFLYADGETQHRTWTIQRIAPGQYTGTAPDVIGTARGEAAGNALHWTYQVELPIGQRQVVVDFDDWMLLQPDGVLVNRAQVRKFGISIGSVTLMFMRSAPAAPPAAALAR